MADIQPQILRKFSPESMLQKINQGKRRTHTFTVDYQEFDPKFTGMVIVHYPSQMEKLQMGVLKSQMLGGTMPLDVITDNLATIISTLEIVIDSKPAWLDVFSDDVEYDILEGVYLEYLQWVNSFRKPTEPDTNEGDSENQPS